MAKNYIMSLSHCVYSSTPTLFRSPENVHFVFPHPRQHLHISPSRLSTDCTVVSIRNFGRLAGRKTEWPCPLTHTKLTHTFLSLLQCYFMIFLCRLRYESFVCEGLACLLSARFVLSGILRPLLHCASLGARHTEKQRTIKKKESGEERAVMQWWDFFGLTADPPGSDTCSDDRGRCTDTFYLTCHVKE